jgi:quercetin dioxygenase-like cupin family protein
MKFERAGSLECMDTVNIFGAENTEGRVDVARAVGSSATSMFIYDLAPGQRQSPYHYEYEEEWLLVVEGTLVLRAPDGEHTLERGDVVCVPAGPAGAHQLMNRSESPARTFDVLELAGAGGLCLSRQRQDRRVAGRRGERSGLQPRYGGAVVGNLGLTCLGVSARLE